MKRPLLRLLQRLGLLLFAYRAYEALRAVRGGGGTGSDGLPLPPARFRVMVAGTPGADWFLGRAGYGRLDPRRLAGPSGVSALSARLRVRLRAGRALVG